MQPYIKLAALLEQSQKNGSKQLRNALELEMVSAFEQRKNAARKMGEEAGTQTTDSSFINACSCYGYDCSSSISCILLERR